MRFSNNLTYPLLPFLKEEKLTDQHYNKVGNGKDGEMDQTFHYTLPRWVSVLQGMMMTDLRGVKDPKGKNERLQNFP